MPLYEHIVMLRSDVPASQVDEILEKRLETLRSLGGGVVEKPERWGLRSLAYPVKKNTHAHYALLRIDSEPNAVKEMERVESLDADVLRFLTVRVDKHEEGPSAVLRQKDKQDESRERRDDTNADDKSPDDAQRNASPDRNHNNNHNHRNNHDRNNHNHRDDKNPADKNPENT